jgi:hypothetical protein
VSKETHNRALHTWLTLISSFVLLISSATAIGPLVAAYMVQYSPGTWRDYVWVSAALAGFNLVVMIIFYPESNFHRSHTVIPEPVPSDRAQESTFADESSPDREKHGASSHSAIEMSRPHGVQHVDHVRISWQSVWFSFLKVDSGASFIKVFLHPFVFLSYPSVLWGIFVYGAALSSQVILV